MDISTFISLYLGIRNIVFLGLHHVRYGSLTASLHLMPFLFPLHLFRLVPFTIAEQALNTELNM